MRRAPYWAAATQRSAPTRRWVRGGGLASPGLPRNLLSPTGLGLIPACRGRLPSGGLRPRVVVGFPIPGPAAPLPPASSPPSSASVQQGPPRPRSSFGRSGFSRLWPWSSCFPSSPVSSVCPGCFSRNRPRDLSNPDIFVFTFPILRVFIVNRMGGSKQS